MIIRQLFDILISINASAVPVSTVIFSRDPFALGHIVIKFIVLFTGSSSVKPSFVKIENRLFGKTVASKLVKVLALVNVNCEIECILF